MIYITGDTHGRFERIDRFTVNMQTRLSDVMIILGDAGLNFYLNKRDAQTKNYVNQFAGKGKSLWKRTKRSSRTEQTFRPGGFI